MPPRNRRTARPEPRKSAPLPRRPAQALRGRRGRPPAAGVRVWRTTDPTIPQAERSAEATVERSRIDSPPGAIRRREGSRRDGTAFVLPEEVVEELERLKVGRGVVDAFTRAVDAYGHDRYPEALRLLASIRRQARTPAVEELYGLTLYRMGRWSQALRALVRVSAETGSVDQYPVVMDCWRALGRREKVEAAYEELRRSSPGAELMAEARIVRAGAAVDEGDLSGAIDILGRSAKPPRTFHVRQWYALASLYEQAGDYPAARRLFRMVLQSGREPYDAAERLAALD